MVLTWSPEDLKQQQGRVQTLTEVLADISPEEKQ